MTTQIPRPGRPLEIPDRVTLAVYLSAPERRAIRRAARRAQVSASAWVRAAALAMLRRKETSHAR